MSRRSNPDDFSCTRCEESFSQEVQFITHWDKEHSDFCFVCDKPIEDHPACRMCGVLAGEDHATELTNTIRGRDVCENCYNFCVGRPWREIKLYVHRPKGGKWVNTETFPIEPLDKIPALAR